MKAKYINPYTHFGFKKLFGGEASKDLLIDFLNQLLPSKHKIVNLTFKNPEQLGPVSNERKAILDIHCENEKGDQFFVEMQKDRIKFFKDRAAFYTSFPIRKQVEKGEWDFKLKPVYCVAILGFKFEDDREQKNHLTRSQLKDEYCQTFYDKLTYIFIEMPRFTRKEEELENHFDKWLYFLKNLEDFESIPDILKEEVFIKGFEIAEIANFDEKELAEYEESLKVYRDLKAVIDTAFEEGFEKGKKAAFEKRKDEKARELAKAMKIKGYPIEDISGLTKIPGKEIEKL